MGIPVSPGRLLGGNAFQQLARSFMSEMGLVARVAFVELEMDGRLPTFEDISFLEALLGHLLIVCPAGVSFRVAASC